MKKTIIKAAAIGLFALLLAFNITTTINGTTDANVDVSLSGLTALAQTSGEDGCDEITCWSAGKFHLGFVYVECSTCKQKQDYRHTDGESTCCRD